MADQNFPLPSYHFRVTIDDVVCRFKEVSGLEQEFTTLEHRAGNEPSFIKAKRIAMVKTSTLSLKRGVIKSTDDLSGYFEDAINKEEFFETSDNYATSLSIIIELLDEAKECMVKWVVAGATPIKFSFGNLDSQKNEINIESMDFIHEGMTVSF